MKVCFIGIGSIAKRHIRNLKKISMKDHIDIVIDAVSRSGTKGTDKVFELVDNVYSSIETSNTMYDVVFITNPTEYHLDALNRATYYGKNFFIEKPIVSVSHLNRINRFKTKSESVYYVACPLRYSAVIQYIKNNISPDDVISVRSISSSYLPDWRPEQDYRNTYSAQKKLGGGVSIDLIHEWDYLSYLFGKPLRLNYMSGKKSQLEIDSDDYSIYIGEYSDKIVELHLDYFGRKTIREIMLFTKYDTIVGDMISNNIRFLKSGKIVNFTEERDDYQIRELRHFLDMINGKCKEDNNITHAIEVLKLTQGML